MPPAIEKILPTLKVGEVSQPIQTTNSVELIQLVAKKCFERFEFIQNQARQVLFQQKFDEQMTSLLHQLRGSAYIKIMS